MTDNEPIKPEWLTGKGYEIDPIFGATKDFGDVKILVGYFPRNAPCVSIRPRDGGCTIITNANSPADIETLERLLTDAFVDYDDVEYVEAGELPD